LTTLKRDADPQGAVPECPDASEREQPAPRYDGQDDGSDTGAEPSYRKQTCNDLRSALRMAPRIHDGQGQGLSQAVALAYVTE